MNIVICAGGTGSVALQTGLYNLLDRNFDGVDTKVLINCFDNGLSTGKVRQVMNGKILGPSDLRKNQSTRLTLENQSSPWIPFLDIRFTCETSKAQEYCLDQIEFLDKKLGYEHNIQILNSAVKEYFGVKFAHQIDYTDFSLANIIYAGLAKLNNYSLRKAGTIMAGLMGIKDNVILNDDTSLFLGAITKSGKRITDEGDIVSWGDENDPFIDVFFTDRNGGYAEPYLSNEAELALRQADLIILSSGTLWSSLIPTYKTVGFPAACQNSKIIMIMNREPDKDSPGQTAQEVINILTDAANRMFSRHQLHVIADSTGSKQMNTLTDTSKVASFHSFDLAVVGNGPVFTRVHDYKKLAEAVGLVYFDEYLDSEYFMFDYDDTLVGRGNKYPRASEFNVKAVNALDAKVKIGICTGNSIDALNLKMNWHQYDWSKENTKLTVFADGGVNKYEYDNSPTKKDDNPVKHKFVECIAPSCIIEEADEIILSLTRARIPLSKIENRNNTSIAIKPIDAEYRDMVHSLVEYVVGDRGLIVSFTGRTTIEIHTSNLSKAHAINHVFESEKPSSITYVGDELNSGNDAVLVGYHPRLKCLSVENPVKTAFFLIILGKT